MHSTLDNTIIKQSNPRKEISMISFVCFQTGRQVRPFDRFSSFFECCALGMNYGACKILIADFKCTMRTSFLPSFVSLGDQGDPTEPLIRKCCQAGCVWPSRLAVYDHLLSFIAKITLSYFKGYFLCTEFCWLIKQSNPRNEISMISFVCFGTGGQIRTFEIFFPFFQSLCIWHVLWGLQNTHSRCQVHYDD